MTNLNKLVVSSLFCALSISAQVLPGSIVLAQAPSLSFEAASVKPNKSGDTNSRMSAGRNGALTVTNGTVKSLIRAAYDVDASQVIGGPAWIDADRFDINAKAEGEISEPRLKEMLKSLLADRFNLVVHQETRELPVYALVLARADGKFGPQLNRSDVDCAALARSGGPPPTGPATAASQGRPIGPCSMRIGGGTMAVRSNSMGDIARALIGAVDRIVVDRTGLKGGFDLDLIWTANPTPEVSGPSIFTALQEQLGLKLEAAHAPVEVVVIDRIEQPGPD
jgi:uncharacterized protein (TIGR03435 family)